jgi:hypothetical protein
MKTMNIVAEKSEREIMEVKVALMAVIKAHDPSSRDGFSIEAESFREKWLDEKWSRLTEVERKEYESWEDALEKEYGPIPDFWNAELGLSWEECKARCAEKAK